MYILITIENITNVYVFFFFTKKLSFKFLKIQL